MAQGPNGVTTQIQDLINWGISNHAVLNPDIEIYHDPLTGLSFKATYDLPPRSPVVTCSYAIALSYLNAIQAPQFPSRSPPLPRHFLETLSEKDPHIIGHFFLMQQYLLKEKSFWYSYIRLLPQPGGVQGLGIPIWWPEADRKFLVGSNVEPAMVKRKEMWKKDWKKGIALLMNSGENAWEAFEYEGYNLYQWAATIFGSRSFRASLTFAEGMLDINAREREHVGEDRFSVLLPILDIGNHDGVNNAEWKADAEHGLCFSTRNEVKSGSQVYNYYGDKSNSELLVAYGFILTESSDCQFDKDRVNLKLKPSPEVLAVRRSQKCHAIPQLPEQEFMFTLQNPPFETSACHLRSPFSHLPHGLVDLVLCMVVNKRELRYLNSRGNDYCLGREPNLFQGELYKSSLHALNILCEKLSYEINRIAIGNHQLGAPQNDNQTLAMDYRNRQLYVLKNNLTALLPNRSTLKSSSSICGQFPRTQNFHNPVAPDQNTEMLSLECAFEWLRLNYTGIFNTVVKIISEDQEESLPLNWAVLVEDWDHTYWTVWIVILWLLWARDGAAFLHQHHQFGSWMVKMNSAYNEEEGSVLYAESSEEATIDLMIGGIVIIPEINTPEMSRWLEKSTSKVRNFGSWLAHEETFSMSYDIHDPPGQAIVQKVLCVGRRDMDLEDMRNGSWMDVLKGSPGYAV